MLLLSIFRDQTLAPYPYGLLLPASDQCGRALLPDVSMMFLMLSNGIQKCFKKQNSIPFPCCIRIQSVVVAELKAPLVYDDLCFAELFGFWLKATCRRQTTQLHRVHFAFFSFPPVIAYHSSPASIFPKYRCLREGQRQVSGC
jgi:hypothetical protein